MFSKNSFRNTIRVSNGLDPDQDRRFVIPDLGPTCLQMLSADDRGDAIPVNKSDLYQVCTLNVQT